MHALYKALILYAVDDRPARRVANIQRWIVRIRYVT
jgi:hypothetical protein